jgi:hypothetical protein
MRPKLLNKSLQPKSKLFPQPVNPISFPQRLFPPNPLLQQLCWSPHPQLFWFPHPQLCWSLHPQLGWLGQGQLHTVLVVVVQVPVGQSAAAVAAVNDTIKKTTSNRLSVFFILLNLCFTILIHSKILSSLIEI